MKKNKDDFFIEFLEKNTTIKKKIKDVHIHNNCIYLNVENKFESDFIKFKEDIELYFPHFGFDKIFICEEMNKAKRLGIINFSGITSVSSFI
jgi:hypothetical protein